jgi:GT2 family glycosyltransferase
MDRIIIVSCTQKNKSDFEKTPLGKSILKLKNNAHMPIHSQIYYDNKRGLCECYNDAIKEFSVYDEHYSSILVFIHDDVYIEDSFFSEKLVDGLKRYDVVGVAGTTKWALKHPTVWHSVKCDWSGMVPHKLNGKYIVTKYGEYLRNCIVMDGMFLAVKMETFMKTELRFDERLKFHHYDIDFCLTAKKLGLKQTTLPLWLVHCSEGRWQDDPVWHESEKVIMGKWSK